MGSKSILKRRILAGAIAVVLLCLLAPVSVPLSFTPIPLSLGTFIVCICGACLGSTISSAAVGVYLLLGMFGVPVLAGRVGGFSVFFGGNFGYLIGYVLCAAIVGKIIQRDRRFKIHMYPIAMAAGLVVCYILGLITLSISLGTDFIGTMRRGFAPFYLFELVKIAAATVISYPLGTRLRNYLHFN